MGFFYEKLIFFLSELDDVYSISTLATALTGDHKSTSKDLCHVSKYDILLNLRVAVNGGIQSRKMRMIMTRKKKEKREKSQMNLNQKLDLHY